MAYLQEEVHEAAQVAEHVLDLVLDAVFLMTDNTSGGPGLSELLPPISEAIPSLESDDIRVVAPVLDLLLDAVLPALAHLPSVGRGDREVQDEMADKELSPPPVETPSYKNLQDREFPANKMEDSLMPGWLGIGCFHSQTAYALSPGMSCVPSSPDYLSPAVAAALDELDSQNSLLADIAADAPSFRWVGLDIFTV